MMFTADQLQQIKDRFVNGSVDFAHQYQDVSMVECPPIANGWAHHPHYVFDLNLDMVMQNKDWWLEHGCPTVLMAIFAQAEPMEVWEFMNTWGMGTISEPLAEYSPGSRAREQEWDDTFLPRLKEWVLDNMLTISARLEQEEAYAAIN